ncbi:MAG: hypothetical protein KGL57_10270 [Burkholderiales bacterium]|nr:hypothetical protein [Burkholderiales bacterium]
MRHPCAHVIAGGCCLWLMVGVCHAQEQAQAQPVVEQLAAPSAPEDDLWLTVSNRQLDHLRGGFDFGSGLVVSFGISRVVYINDQLVSSTAFQLGDVAHLSQAQVSALGQQLAALTGQVVQNGPGNTIDPSALAVPLSTYIQNTFNNQNIRVETVIQAATNGMSLLKGLNFQALMNDVATNAIVNR